MALDLCLNLKIKKMRVKLKIVITLLIFAFFLSSCSWDEWLHPPEVPRSDLFIPDSLKFQQKTGDTVIFTSTGDSVVYDTFRLENTSYMRMSPVYEYNEVVDVIEYELNYLNYNNKTTELSLEKIYYNEELIFHNGANGRGSYTSKYYLELFDLGIINN